MAREEKKTYKVLRETQLFLDFDLDGLWVSFNEGAPFLLVALSPTAMAAGDMDSNGQDDLVFSIAGFGTLVFKNLSALEVLDSSAALDIATGNVDGN